MIVALRLRIPLPGASLLLCLLWLLLLSCACDQKTVSETDSKPAGQEQAAVIQTPENGTPPPFEEPYPQPPQTQGLDTAPSGNDGCDGREQEKTEKPRIAIIIDDMGFHRDLGRQLLALNLELTFSFLPHAPHTAELEAEAYQMGREILLHQPMEARDPKWEPGPGAILLHTGADEIGAIVKANLQKVPHAVGINNHMGSRLTEEQPIMNSFLATIKDHRLFFVDSFTTPNSLGMLEAKRLGIKTGRRDVFLDNVHTEQDVCRQLRVLLQRAKKEGAAIGIGHPNQATLAALTSCQAILHDRVTMVKVHELLH